MTTAKVLVTIDHGNESYTYEYSVADIEAFDKVFGPPEHNGNPTPVKYNGKNIAWLQCMTKNK